MNKENFIVFSDIKALFFKVKWIVLAGAIICGFIGFFKRTQIPVQHKVRAIFKEVGQSQARLGGRPMDSLLHSFGMVSTVNEGHVVIQSATILEPAVEKLGMQALIPTRSRFEEKGALFKESLQAEMGRPILPASQFEFADVKYVGDYPKNYKIVFTSKGSFEVQNEDGNILVKGLLGEGVSFDSVQFKLVKIPDEIKFRHHYPLLIAPLSEKVIALRKMLKIKSLNGDASLLRIKMFHPNRLFGVSMINEIMATYMNHIKMENKRLNEGQIAYLERRRDDCLLKMREDLKDHVAYLKENLEKKGVLNLGQELPLVQNRKQELVNDLMGINLKLEKLIDVDPLLASELGREVESFQENLHGISKERDALTLTLLGGKSLSSHLCRLDRIDQEELRIKTGIDTFFLSLSGAILDKDRAALEVGGFGKVLSPDATLLKKVRQEKQRLLNLSRQSGSPLSEDYVKQQIRLLSLQEGSLKERLFHGIARGEEYQGVDLETAKKLLLTYLQRRDEARSKVLELVFAKGEIEKEMAEWISLSSAFPDPLCQEMVKEMGEIKKALRKTRTLTEKEQERLEKKFTLMKEDLYRHIDQSISLTQLEKMRYEDQISSVRMAILDLLGLEVSLIERQIEDRIEEKKTHLRIEKSLVKRQLKEVQEEMKGIPDTWLREHSLKFEADMNKGMLESLVRLVETKSIEQNLSSLESKPIEFAKGPLTPKKPLLKVFGAAATFLGALITFAACFIYYLYRGFPLTIRNMDLRGNGVLGPLSKKVVIKEGSKDLEVLRKFSLRLKEKKRLPLVVCLVLGDNEDYSPFFAELLSEEGKKVLVIDLNLAKKTQEKNLPGLCSFLEGNSEKPHLLNKNYGHYISMEDKISYGEEILRGKAFETFIKTMKEKHDVVLLALPAPLESSLPKTFFEMADVMALRLDGHSYQELSPYFAWESDEGSLVFV